MTYFARSKGLYNFSLINSVRVPSKNCFNFCFYQQCLECLFPHKLAETRIYKFLTFLVVFYPLNCQFTLLSFKKKFLFSYRFKGIHYILQILVFWCICWLNCWLDGLLVWDSGAALGASGHSSGLDWRRGNVGLVFLVIWDVGGSGFAVTSIFSIVH